MNQKAKDHIMKVDSSLTTISEYRRHLLNTKNLSMLCHTSCEMEPVILRYLSANNMALPEKGVFFLLLISDISVMDPAESDGISLFTHAFSYVPVREIVYQHFTGHYMFYDAEMDGQMVILLCFPYGLPEDEKDRGFARHIAHECEVITAECKEEYDIDIAVYLSPAIFGFRPISLNYRHLLNYNVYRHFIGRADNTSCITLPDFASKAMITHQLRSYAQHLTSTILQFGDSLSLARRIMDSLTGYPIVSVDDLTTHFGNFMDFLCLDLLDSGVPLEREKFYEILPEKLNNSLFWKDITDWFYDWLEETIRRYNRKYQSDVFQRFDRIKAFIDENFPDPNLNVAYIADHFGINQAFLSTTYKKQYKSSISSYIQTLRLSHAEELLKHTDASIRDIYTRCGFSSAETFYRNFKKEFGITPNKIRNSEGSPAK